MFIFKKKSVIKNDLQLQKSHSFYNKLKFKIGKKMMDKFFFFLPGR